MRESVEVTRKRNRLREAPWVSAIGWCLTWIVALVPAPLWDAVTIAVLFSGIALLASRVPLVRDTACTAWRSALAPILALRLLPHALGFLLRHPTVTLVDLILVKHLCGALLFCWIGAGGAEVITGAAFAAAPGLFRNRTMPVLKPAGRWFWLLPIGWLAIGAILASALAYQMNRMGLPL